MFKIKYGTVCHCMRSMHCSNWRYNKNQGMVDKPVLTRNMRSTASADKPSPPIASQTQERWTRHCMRTCASHFARAPDPWLRATYDIDLACGRRSMPPHRACHAESTRWTKGGGGGHARSGGPLCRTYPSHDRRGRLFLELAAIVRPPLPPPFYYPEPWRALARHPPRRRVL